MNTFTDNKEVHESGGANSCSSVISLFDAYVVPNYKRNFALIKGEGTKVWDEAGKSYLDFGGGIAVNCLGHAHPRITQTLTEQSRKLVHVSNLYYSEPQGKLAQRIVEKTGPGKVFFCNSGAEANEALFKLSRKFGAPKNRYEIITATKSFHGRTFAGISATGQNKVKTDFQPLLPGFKHAPFNDLEAFKNSITEQTVGILIEGIQGEGGIHLADPQFLLGLRKLTQEHEILLLWDGVQCGAYRTGSWQSYERILQDSGSKDFLPDGIAMAKSLGGGFPIGATWIAQPYADLLQPGTHGTTFGGTPLGCAVANTVLDVIEEEELNQNITARSEQIIQELSPLVDQDKIKTIRGLGGMIGFEPSISNFEAVKKLTLAGLLTVPAGDNIVRLLPPLNITENETHQALNLIKETL
ncbi:MAG: acetylornithine/succinylornithine family transaminase [Verrucomicrobiota bacterium]